VSGGFLVLLLAMFGFMYFLLIRPQRQQQRKHTELLSSLKPGDEVVTAGGIYGEVVQLDAERVMLEIDEDVRIAVARRSIASIIPPEELERLEAGEEAGAEGERVDADSTEPLTADEPMTAEQRDAARN
jgi:preprotein translocase subunit YajC